MYFVLGIIIVVLVILDQAMNKTPKPYSSKRGPGTDHVFDEDYIDTKCSGHGHDW